MCFHLRFSIQWNILVLVAVIAVCLVQAAYCQRRQRQRRTTKKMRTTVRYLEDPMYVQKFVSKMMSKYTIQNAEKVDGAYAASDAPNLGHEPYWYNVPDVPWKDKCARCSDLFKRYKTVCAVDSTGDVMVNISLCKMMQMNCLGGIVQGSSTGILEDYRDDFFVVADGWARFALRQDKYAVIALSHTPDRQYPRYATTLDGWTNSDWSATYKNGYLHDSYYSRWIRALKGKNEWAEFVVSWNSTSGWMLMTRSDYSNWTHGFHLNSTDYHPFPIKYITISGAYGYKGDWIIKDLPTGFIVTQLSPCASTVQALARPLVTSPTEVPGILSRLSPANIGFYSRIDSVGAQHENVSFLTREEY